jgi:LysM repeat protein
MSRLRTIDKLVLATLAVAGGSTVLPVLHAAPAAAAPSANGATYTVKNGDFLAGIATKLKVKLADLLTANRLEVTSLILPGQQLVVPGAAPAAAPAGSPATAPAASGGAYVVKAGDSLLAIAGKLKVKLADLLAANGMTVTSLILPGQRLTVPAGGTLPGAPATPAAAPAAASAATYTVVPGDYLFGIAGKLKVKLSALLQANGLTATSLILPGQALNVPAGGTVPPAATISAGTSAAAPPVATSGSKVDTIIAFAMAQLGKPYRFFAAGPDAYDCSGLVVAAFRAAGMGIVHQSLAQSQLGTAVDWVNGAIQAGDLIFTARSGGDPSVVGHVGIATSATQWVNATRAGDMVRAGAIPPDSRILAVRRFV